MAEPRSSVGSSTSGDFFLGGGRIVPGGWPLTPSPLGPETTMPSTLVKPSKKRRGRGHRVFQMFRNMFRTLPVFNPKCSRIMAAPICRPAESRKGASGTLVTGTLFGHRKGRVSLSLQESPWCMPTLILELSIQTQVLLLDEPLWAMFCNGKKMGYGLRREASPEDMRTMELLRPMSMGAGVLPGKSEVEGSPNGEVAYMRANFEHVVASRDSETLYMISPEGNNGPDLTVFFVRI